MPMGGISKQIVFLRFVRFLLYKFEEFGTDFINVIISTMCLQIHLNIMRKFRFVKLVFERILASTDLPQWNENDRDGCD